MHLPSSLSMLTIILLQMAAGAKGPSRSQSGVAETMRTVDLLHKTAAKVPAGGSTRQDLDSTGSDAEGKASRRSLIRPHPRHVLLQRHCSPPRPHRAAGRRRNRPDCKIWDLRPRRVRRFIRHIAVCDVEGSSSIECDVGKRQRCKKHIHHRQKKRSGHVDAHKPRRRTKPGKIVKKAGGGARRPRCSIFP